MKPCSSRHFVFLIIVKGYQDCMNRLLACFYSFAYSKRTRRLKTNPKSQIPNPKLKGAAEKQAQSAEFPDIIKEFIHCKTFSGNYYLIARI